MSLKRAFMLAGAISIAFCISVQCSSPKIAERATIRWNLHTGDRLVYKFVMDFPDEGLGRSRAEVVAEIEVLVDLGDGDYVFGSRLRDVYAKWMHGEWRSGGSKPLPEDGVPNQINLLALETGKNCATGTAYWGVGVGRLDRDREEAINEVKKKGWEFCESSVLRFDRLLLPRSPVEVGATWKVPPSPISVDPDGPMLASEGRLLAVEEGSTEFECKMMVIKPGEPSDGRYDALPNLMTTARVIWRNDIGILRHCVLEEKEVYPKATKFKRTEVTLLSMIRDGKSR